MKFKNLYIFQMSYMIYTAQGILERVKHNSSVIERFEGDDEYEDDQCKLAKVAFNNDGTVQNIINIDKATNTVQMNGIRFSKGWTKYPDDKTDGAEISNDTSAYKQLMIVGNRAGGDNIRRINMWDELNMNGELNILGNPFSGRRSNLCIGSTCGGLDDVNNNSMPHLCIEDTCVTKTDLEYLKGLSGTGTNE